jgi:hypothetical protein
VPIFMRSVMALNLGSVLSRHKIQFLVN